MPVFLSQCLTLIMCEMSLLCIEKTTRQRRQGLSCKQADLYIGATGCHSDDDDRFAAGNCVCVLSNSRTDWYRSITVCAPDTAIWSDAPHRTGCWYCSPDIWTNNRSRRVMTEVHFWFDTVFFSRWFRRLFTLVADVGHFQWMSSEHTRMTHSSVYAQYYHPTHAYSR